MGTYRNRSRYLINKTKKQLHAIIDDNPRSLKAAVASEALEYSDDPVWMFIDLAHCGCQSGTIGSLIYYSDTHAFFDRYYDEIEELRGDMEDSFGEPLNIKHDLKNWLAWFAFEETAFRMAGADLGLEL